MEPKKAAHVLKKLIPDVELANVPLQADGYDENKMIVILENHFHRKRLKCSAIDHDLKAELKYIKKVFPSMSSADILEHLESFKDLPNRKEVVLRLILRSRTATNASASVSVGNIKRGLQGTEHVDSVNNNIPRKLIKLEHFSINDDIPQCQNPCLLQTEIGVPSFSAEDRSNIYDNVESVNAELAPFVLPEDKNKILINRKPCTVTSSSEEQEPMQFDTVQENENHMSLRDVPKVNFVESSNDPLKLKFYRLPKLLQEEDTSRSDPMSFNNVAQPEVLDLSKIGVTGFDCDSDRDVSKTPLDSNETDIYENYFQAHEGNIEELTRFNDFPTIKFSLDPYLDSGLAGASKSNEGLPFNRVAANVTDIDSFQPNTRIPNIDIEKNYTVTPSTSEQLQKQIIVKEETIDLSSSVTEDPEVITAETHDLQLVNHLCSIFPDACPNYIKGLCKNKKLDDVVLDSIINIILDTNNQYPKRQLPPQEPDVYPENQLEILKEFLPDADPDYLRMMCDRFEGKPEKVQMFLNEAMERRNYPTMKEYQRRQQLSTQQRQYTSEFSVKNFVKVIPDPLTFFSDASRTTKLDDTSLHYTLVFLRNRFNKLPVKMIQSTFSKNGFKLSKTIKKLNKEMSHPQSMLKTVRKPISMPSTIHNIPLLQEIAFYTHEEAIKAYLKELKKQEEEERNKAKSQGLMKSCGCCYDEEILPKDIFCCANGCQFCKSCVVKSTEVLFGEGKLAFPCLLNCSSSFSLQCLQAALPPKLFSKIAQKKALEEVKAAGIEDLEMCPFCDFATIPAEGYNIFTCQNPDCMKESCRMCKEPSHMPLRCDEIEKDEDVRARTYVENKMTEALLRKCWKCNIKFFKEEGCNKMTCSCGAKMCYVCCQPVKDYKHFNGNGGDRYDLCPLYSDTVVLNKKNVLKGAEQAKAEIGNVNLKHDPTKDVEQHYNTKKPHVIVRI